MKRIIRAGVFETNSSSTHSLTMVDEKVYEEWKQGKLLFHKWQETFVPADSKEKPENEDEDEEDEDDKEDEDDELCTYEKYFDMREYKTFLEKHITPKGETVIAFGYYGNDY